jgi:hypothetical protein
MWTRSSRQEDYFFGADGDDEMAHDGVARCDTHKSDPFTNGLAFHEAAAVEERYRTLGYHETYESSREATLQGGFTHGYTQTFPIALNIGRLLGQAAIAQKLTELQVSERNHEATDDTPIERQSSATVSDSCGSNTIWIAGYHVQPRIVDCWRYRGTPQCSTRL